jgi:acetyltransferase-like isoleucine patch superfamily enzyme
MRTPQFIKNIRGALRQRRLEARYKFQFESPIRVNPAVKLSKSSFVGRFSYIGDNSLIFGDVKIGRYCSIADGFVAISGNHPFDHLTTHPIIHNNQLFGHLREYREIDYKKRKREADQQAPPLVIGNDVWIGNRVTVLGKVRRIGDGAVVGAGSIVTKDVPDYAIVAGNPATVLRYRFDAETVRSLLETSWWSRPIGAISAMDFSDVKKCVTQLRSDSL